MAKLAEALTGISGILVTPYDSNDRIAPALQAPVVERAIAAGVHILVANGNTGEFYGLTMDEAERMVHSAGEHINGRIPLLGGVGRSVHDACHLARISKKAGADALMVHQPPDPFSAPRGFIEYVRRVAEAADGLPLMLYLRNDAIGAKGIAELCAIEGVAGVKWATPNVLKLSEAINATDASIIWVGGLAETWAPPLYAVGARGFTSGLINVWPERSVAIHAALAGGDYTEAASLIAGMKVFEDIRSEELNGTNVTGVKAALKALGHDCGHARPPSAWPLTDAQQNQLDTFIAAQRLPRF
ncbi:dihydrodipicolinate synthase family protein [Mesorhizobium sp. WSM2239]|uniref:Dihydrodipicolinate synthase family protein n=2 Tax=unclassified Mesorhizobium TaxID=325217 RepID=A0AAU8DIQ7_9HYPH